ncbi:hypothetical protein IWX50DRAFT_644907 [Phyllosticta citricarpa]
MAVMPIAFLGIPVNATPCTHAQIVSPAFFGEACLLDEGPRRYLGSPYNLAASVLRSIFRLWTLYYSIDCLLGGEFRIFVISCTE